MEYEALLDQGFLVGEPIDLAARRIVFHRDPGTTGFGTVETITDGVVGALQHPAVQVNVRDLLSAD